MSLLRAYFADRYGGQGRALGLACLLLGGCAAATPEPPKLEPLPPAFKENADWKAAQPADQIPRGTWWQVFHDPQLDALQARIDAANLTLRAQQARFAQARAAVAIASSGRYPVVTTAPQISGGTQSGNRNNNVAHVTSADLIL